jgi:hypothetical protein
LCHPCPHEYDYVTIIASWIFAMCALGAWRCIAFPFRVALPYCGAAPFAGVIR